MTPTGRGYRGFASTRVFAAATLAASAWALGAGCELVAGVDRTEIPGAGGSGGAGGAGGAPTPPEGSSGPMTASAASSSSAGGACPGGMASCLSPNDCPPTGTDCIDRFCNGGCCGVIYKPPEAPCATNGGSVCNGAGSCVKCVVGSDCPATGTGCATPFCNGSGCAVANSNKGAFCADHGGVVCDGNGACVATHCNDGIADADETDTDCGGSCSPCNPGFSCLQPSDCTSKVCKNSFCSFPDCKDGTQNGNETDVDCGATCPTKCPLNEHCSTNVDCASAVCLGNNPGTCIACNVAGDCASTGNECVIATCVGHSCDTSNLDQTHTLSRGQTSGDCQRLVCDGMAGATSIDDATDPPPPSGTICSQSPTCAGTPLAPSFAMAAANTDCTGDNNPPKHLCGGGLNAGVCVQCNSAADCAPGSCLGSVFTFAESCNAAGACVVGSSVNCAATGQICSGPAGCVDCVQSSDCNAWSDAGTLTCVNFVCQ